MSQILTLPSKTSRSQRSRPATFYVARGSADIRWRVELPCRHLGARLVSWKEKEAVQDLMTPNEREKLPWRLTEEGSEYPAHEGTAVWIRPDMIRATHAASMSANGIRTIAEVDDNYLSPPTQNIFMRQNNYNAAGRRSHLQAFATFDAIVTSTEYLRDLYAKTIRKELRKNAVPEMFVCRNHVDADDWERRVNILPASDGRLRVGWMGSHQHLWDLRLAAPALRLAYDLGCEVVFVGLDPKMWDPAWKEFLPVYTHVPWTKRYHKYRLNFDIGLIPLVQNQHTDGKSDVKFLEYAMSGAATVCESSPIYNKTIIHNETGLLSNSPDDMAHQMYHLIKHPYERQQMAVAAKEWVIENRTMQKQGVQEWRAALG